MIKVTKKNFRILFCFPELPVFQDYSLHPTDILKPWKIVITNIILYDIHNYFFTSFFEYGKGRWLCMIQLKKGCRSMVVHPVSGRKVYVESVNMLQCLVSPGWELFRISYFFWFLPDASVYQKWGWYTSWLFKCFHKQQKKRFFFFFSLTKTVVSQNSSHSTFSFWLALIRTSCIQQMLSAHNSH